MKKLHLLLIVLTLLGFLDASYLTYEHFANVIPPCTANAVLGDCGAVLRSEYSQIFGIPLALIGMIHYATLFITLILSLRKKKAKYFALMLSVIGILSSLYFVSLMLFVIQAICVYCFVSAIICVLLFTGIQLGFKQERITLLLTIFHLGYKHFMKYFLFKFHPETIHVAIVSVGELFGKIKIANIIKDKIFGYKDKCLSQTIVGITFSSPIGLAAGFDYEARLTQILPSMGFGFQTVGTITNGAYQGNPRPMLGRLPKSKSLMVNKGFKNLGAKATIKKLAKLEFKSPVGVSIGRTNSLSLKTQTQSIRDIKKTFQLFEKSSVQHSYYELNISCPNLKGNITFYPPQNLEELLTSIDALQLTKPLFIKMPIEKSNREVLAMLKVIAKHKVQGVIFGNLQKDRNNETFVKSELEKFPMGNFSGKPTYERSNELISLTYKHYKKRLVIIGCGGVFNAQDAYEKIKRGATLVQLITGMIFEGPQLVAQINNELPRLLRSDGLATIKEAIGSATK